MRTNRVKKNLENSGRRGGKFAAAAAARESSPAWQEEREREREREQPVGMESVKCTE